MWVRGVEVQAVATATIETAYGLVQLATLVGCEGVSNNQTTQLLWVPSRNVTCVLL
eukprot:SAG31_NODE_44871_length_261_cov_0.629630_1_plen_55_part_10